MIWGIFWVIARVKGFGQILALDGLSLFSNEGQGIAEDSNNATYTLSCLLMLGLVSLLDRLKCYIFGQSFCSTLIAYF